MTQLETRPRKTIEDYLRLPDDVRAELIEGEILMSPAPTLRHQRILWKLSAFFDGFLKTHRVGEAFFAPVDVHLPSGDMVQPDLVFVAAASSKIMQEKRIEGAPDLLVEILSPGNTERDLLVKRALYARNGVKEYWIADGETRSIEVNVLSGASFVPGGWFQVNDTLASPALPGLALPVRSVFE